MTIGDSRYDDEMLIALSEQEFHERWSSAVGTVGYSKEWWIRVDRLRDAKRLEARNAGEPDPYGVGSIMDVFDVMCLDATVAALQDGIAAVEERVRLHEVARRYLQGVHNISSGDYVRFEDGFATRVRISSAGIGKWTYQDRHGHCVEPFRVPPEDGIERLYTIAEVAEILAQASQRKEPP